MRFWSLAFPIVLLLGARGCTLDLDGARCDCADGYLCCQADGICYRPGHACGSGGSATEESGGSAALASGGTAQGTGGAVSGGGGSLALGGASASGAAPGSSGGVLGGDAGAAGATVTTGGDGPVVDGGAATGGAATGGAATGGIATGGIATGGAPEMTGGAAGGGGEGGSSEASGGSATGFAVFAVPTQHNDNLRTGVNPLETALNQASVGGGSFGELARRALRGAVFAQPLLIPKVPNSGGAKNIVYVATMANVVYAFDAQDAGGSPLWVRVLDAPIELPDARIPLGADGIWHEVGILGTPTISGGSLYAVAASKDGESYSHRLYALDLPSGEVSKSVVIAAPGFDSAGHAQRAGLTVQNGVLYVAFGGYSLKSDASGWLFAYDTNLDLLGSVNLGNPSGAGVTMSGQAPAVDADGAIYFSTSPGASSAPSVPAWGKSLLKLVEPKADGVVTLHTRPDSSSRGGDFGNTGPLLIPGSSLALASGPTEMYVLKRDGTGANLPPVQTVVVNQNDGCSGVEVCDAAPFPPVIWAGASGSDNQRLYTWLPSDLLRGFSFDSRAGKFANCPEDGKSCKPFAQSVLNDSSDFLSHSPARGAALSFSSNLDTPGSSLVWAAHGYKPGVSCSDDGVLRAFDADTLSALWASNSGEVSLGPLAPGATPTVSDGRVYMGTADGLTERHTFTGNGNGGSPALANFAEKYLVMAWGLAPSVTRGFELAWSSDGVNFDETSIVPARFLPYEPALAADDTSHLYLGWCDVSEKAQVFVADDPRFTSYQSMQQRQATGAFEPLELAATSPPALAFGNHRLFMAWHNEAGLHFISSSDGIAFELSTLLDFPEYFAYPAPLLSYHDDRLFLASTTPDGAVHLFISSDDGEHFGPPSTLPMSSNGHPALLWDTLTGSDALSYTWLWSEKANGGVGALRVSTGPIADFSVFTGIRPLAGIVANLSIAAARFKGSWYVAWSDAPSGALPNVARYSPGELVTYGLRAQR